jgi:hypothetical protein
MMANDGYIAKNTLFEPERQERAPLTGTQGLTRTFIRARGKHRRRDAEYMAAPDQLPKVTETLVTREPSIHGPSDHWQRPSGRRIHRKSWPREHRL